MSILSSPDDLDKVRDILIAYARLPFSDNKKIPGSVMEGVLGTVRDADVLNTYDFVDVVAPERGYGWQVKSTKHDTPVTWKRAKIPGAQELIEQSRQNSAGLQKLGNAIIDFCNQHVRESIERYDLKQIAYARLIVHKEGRATYFERTLCTRESPVIFNPKDFEWRWSAPKNTTKKEQLPALHGTHRLTGEKWWAWHGNGENQLHFNGESSWWPEDEDEHSITFRLPSESEKIPLTELLKLLN